jgi:hypothetical protein
VLSKAFEVLSKAFEVLSKAFEVLSKAFEVLSKALEVLFEAFEMLFEAGKVQARRRQGAVTRAMHTLYLVSDGTFNNGTAATSTWLRLPLEYP